MHGAYEGPALENVPDAEIGDCREAGPRYIHMEI